MLKNFHESKNIPVISSKWLYQCTIAAKAGAAGNLVNQAAYVEAWIRLFALMIDCTPCRRALPWRIEDSRNKRTQQDFSQNTRNFCHLTTDSDSGTGTISMVYFDTTTIEKIIMAFHISLGEPTHWNGVLVLLLWSSWEDFCYSFRGISAWRISQYLLFCSRWFPLGHRKPYWIKSMENEWLSQIVLAYAGSPSLDGNDQQIEAIFLAICMRNLPVQLSSFI